MQIAKAAVTRVDEEVQAKTAGIRVGPNQEYASYRDMYEDRIRMTNDSIKQLREEKKYAEVSYSVAAMDVAVAVRGLTACICALLQRTGELRAKFGADEDFHWVAKSA